uniref:Multiple epidermal growth factor-like domains protein 8 n=1 Tax=Lepeophtheirus salmonis TaxID=72036 RepID=A0A0K2SV94_LEPSM
MGSWIWFLFALLLSWIPRLRACTRTFLRDAHGVIGDGPGNYTPNSVCEWFISPEDPSLKYITIEFQELSTECAYDYLFILDGNGSLLASLSGSGSGAKVTSPSGAMHLILYSDTNYALSGFSAIYNSFVCPQNCSERGVCTDNATCGCDEGFTGPDCSIETCPDGCKPGGKCLERKRCVCSPGFTGYDCSLHESNIVGNTWHLLNPPQDTFFSPRTSHSSIVLENSIYFYGGYNLRYVLRDLISYDFETWKKIEPQNNISWPPPLYGHAAVELDSGFVLFGGKDNHHIPSSQVWVYNVSTHSWKRMEKDMPIPLSSHAVARVNETLYIFGGSGVFGEFSSSMFTLQLSDWTWKTVEPRNGKMTDLRVTGHSLVYHSGSESLILFGGLVADLARFSRLSDRIWVYDIKKRKWSELESAGDKDRPPERAYHAAVVIGDYMVIFGGYSHRHNKVEICYDKEIYFYHLGCHSWVSKNILDEGAVQHRNYPEREGLFGASVAVKKPNIIVYSGGYKGSVSGNVWAFTFPFALSIPNNKKVCSKYGSSSMCKANPECGWCSTTGICYPRTSTSNCSSNLRTNSCPGICPALKDCYSCVIHSQRSSSISFGESVVDQLRLKECGWCVHSQTCLPRYATPDPCSLERKIKRDSAAKLTTPNQCTRENFKSGITLFKYSNPPNETYPDEVSIINKTEAEYMPFLNEVLPSSYRRSREEYILRIRGSVHIPHHHYSSSYSLNGSSDDDKIEEERYLLPCVRNAARMVLSLSPRSTGKLRTIINGTYYTTTSCRNNLKWPESGSPIILKPGTSYQIDFSATALFESSMVLNGFFQPPLELSLKSGIDDEQIMPQVFGKDFLRPFRGDGSCLSYKNCFACTADTLCGWCSVHNECLARGDRSVEDRCNDNFLTLDPSMCVNCSSHIYCDTCSNDVNCEYRTRDSKCVRRGSSLYIRKDDRLAITSYLECPIPCHSRSNCSDCLGEPGRCVWCAETEECFLFSVYTSEYRYGRCREWFDRNNFYDEGEEIPEKLNDHIMCRTCSSFSRCSECLKSLGCGWCYDSQNPVNGICSTGSFLNSSSNEVCAMNKSMSWAYSSCPDVDECALNLHNCHENATCSNYPGSFQCNCNRGFIGDGINECLRTCYEDCVHGKCVNLGYENFKCECDLGWSGVDCSLDCNCHNHSTCYEDIGICDKCMNNTTGKHCHLCKEGSFGNATIGGCDSCFCNGHENIPAGICDHDTGDCFCLDLTTGSSCEICIEGFYGDPRHGGKCYHSCSPRKYITEFDSGSFGSYGGNLSIEKDCLWIISSASSSRMNLDDKSNTYFSSIPKGFNAISLTIESVNISCSENSIYIYDGLPPYISSSDNFSILGIVCNEKYDMRNKQFIAHSGVISVYFQRPDDLSQGFNASFQVMTCPKEGCDSDNDCPMNCSSIGECHRGVCICPVGFGDIDCSIELPTQTVPIKTTLFLPDIGGHSFRFGHSMDIDLEETLWIYGGSSGNHVLNDIRAFDTRNNSWIRVTVRGEVSPPIGRYFHASVFYKNVLYIHGGINKTHYLDDFWSFDVITRNWREIKTKENPQSVAGHTLTLNADVARFLLIGGISPMNGFNDKVLEYIPFFNIWREVFTEGYSPLKAGGLYGHSCIYHEGHFYVYGGISFYVDKVGVSNRLYSLNYDTLQWSLLTSFINVQGGSSPMYFHSAISTPKFMMLIGGNPGAVIAYIYDCQTWVGLDYNLNERYLGLAAVRGENSVYLMGGFSHGKVLGDVKRLDIPQDLCRVYDKKSDLCKVTHGCSYCSVYEIVSGTNSSYCYSISSGKEPEECRSFSSGIKESNEGLNCEKIKLSCNFYRVCGECLSKNCRWCSGCNKGQCVHRLADCGLEFLCNLKPKEVTLPEQCPDLICSASDCQKCKTNNSSSECVWTRRVHKSGEQKRKVNESPIYDWNCEQKRVIDHGLIFLKEQQNDDPESCPAPCDSYHDCNKCLSSTGAEGGWSECRWSIKLNECISPGYLQLRCTGGNCGRILKRGDMCPISCSQRTNCKTCLQRSDCGWCSFSSSPLTGIGVCLQGEIHDSINNKVYCLSNSTLGFSQNILSNSLFSTSSSNKWNIEMCPPENECSNNHHDCDPDSEMCIDTELSYKCVCNEGYEKKVSGEGCKPICSQGCLYGKCIEPGVCKCDFSYVGLDCSKQCQCNGHSDCESPERLDVCISCQNNTIGAHCEKCARFYVGDPRNKGKCVSCYDFCNTHSNYCLHSSYLKELNVSGNNKIVLDDRSLQRVSKSIHSGPRDGSETVCVNCEDYTQGRTCEQCVERHFRGTEDTRNDCRPCWCNGHGNTCDQITGENCQCHNNTYSDVHQCRYLRMNLYGRESSCFKYQCSRCKEYYLGYPENGHQCYRVMTVDTEYCFDPETQSECNRIPSPLNAGQAVFFAVQPKFMNVDIRIVIDVTVGEVDVYLAPDSRIFVVENDENWHHNISFDPRFFIFPVSARSKRGALHLQPGGRRRSASSVGASHRSKSTLYYMSNLTDANIFYHLISKKCTKNITFLKVRHTGRILHAKGLKNRLVISLPEAYHDLRTTRFHIVVIGKVSSKVTFGSMYFRQDQLHIDLFVFFSVFFSCFFLFLSFCVVVWKCKILTDVRRARRRHEVEMMHMAQRPFTKILILLNQDESSSSFYVSKKKVGGTCRSRHYHHRRHHNHRKISDQSHNHLRLHMVDCSSNDDEATEESYRIRPVAQEPLIGGSPNINTVLVQYPSGGKSRCLSFGSALINKT